MFKHRLKRGLRAFYARVLYHTGLHVLVDKIAPRRLFILYGHCVADRAINGDLPADMKVSRDKLTRVLTQLGKRFDLVTIGEGARRLEDGTGRSLVALSMDDGYRDNAEILPAVLAPLDAKATVFLESRPLDSRRVNWSHKFFPLVDRQGVQGFAEAFVRACDDPALGQKVREAASRENPVYQVKRVLKYESAPEVRDPAIDRLWSEAGADEEGLCEQLYMTWDQARTLRDDGYELGGHTVNHAVLSTLEAGAQQAEIAGGKSAMERELGEDVKTFAYPFGRAWDFDEHSVSAAREAGFEWAVTTHAGVNVRGADPLRLKRLPIDDTTQIHLVVAEACGGFELLRKFGLDLSE